MFFYLLHYRGKANRAIANRPYKTFYNGAKLNTQSGDASGYLIRHTFVATLPRRRVFWGTYGTDGAYETHGTNETKGTDGTDGRGDERDGWGIGTDETDGTEGTERRMGRMRRMQR